VGIVCKGFTQTVRLIARYEGLSNPRIVEYPPPNIAVHDSREVCEAAARLSDQVIAALTAAPAGTADTAPDVPAAKHAEIVYRGDLDSVNDFFLKNVWADGAPVIPPTVDRVEAFLRFTELAPDHVVGVFPPKHLTATVWKIAVNGVMAGCRPEYMPILIAIAEAVAEPRFGLGQAGSTVGWTPLIILNGPIARQLGFNSRQGVLRPQSQANVTVSRFLRLVMVNIAGYRLGETDMASFGRNYYPVLAEAEDLSPWPPLSADRGFPQDCNVVTVQSADTISHSFLTIGDASEQLRYIALEVAHELGASMLYPMEHFGGEVSPVVCLSPLVAGIIARAGYSKKDVREYLFEHARVPARQFDDRLNRSQSGLNLKEAVRVGRLSTIFALSDDPDRLVPVVHDPREFIIVVAGSPDRNRNFIAAQFGEQGLSVSKEIRLVKSCSFETHFP
jgi:hypothetical protein